MIFLNFYNVSTDLQKRIFVSTILKDANINTYKKIVAEATYLSVEIKLMIFLLDFITHVRPCMINPNNAEIDDLFLTKSGEPMTDALVSTSYR